LSFLNGFLLAGALAFCIPLIIHLLNRSKFQMVDWGAMHLLESVIRVNHRRFQIQQLLLLLVRCSIPVLLALCLAIPVLTNWQALPKDTPSSLALVVDDSYSMDVVDEAGQQTLLQTALSDAQQIVAALPRGSEANVIVTGGRPQTLQDSATVDLDRVDHDLQILAGAAGPNDVPESLKAASIAVATMNNARREVVLMSDFQRDDWLAVSDEVLDRFREQWKSMPTPPAITLLPLGKRDVTKLENLTVEGLELDRATIGVGQEVRLRATVRNHSNEPQPSVRLRLKVNNEAVSATTARLDAEATSQLLMTHTFEKAGSHVVEVELDAEDALATDNRQVATVDVLETIDVLLVDGKPSNQPLRGETGFLSVALSPFAFGRQQLADLVTTKVITAGELDEAALASSRVVILANVGRLNDRQVEWLDSFVRAGNSLVVFAGDQLAVDWYNDKLGATGVGLLPMQLGERQGEPATNAAAAGDETLGKHLVAQFFEHPAMQLFNETGSGSLADADIFAWHPLSPTTGDQANIVARLETGETLIAERSFGDGVVMLVGTAANLDWSNLPMQPTFVPLVQEWIGWMATRGLPPRNIRVGQTAVVHWSKDQDRTWQWTTPDGQRSAATAQTADGRQTLQYAATRRPGVYGLVGKSSNPDVGEATIYIAATADPAESKLMRLSGAEITNIAERLGASIADSGANYLQLDNMRRFGREIWRPLLMALLAMMILEVFLQQYFAGVRG